MKKCDECGHVFADEDIARWKEDRGEHFGFPCQEELCGCPMCNGSFSELEACDLCEEEVIEEDSKERFCEDCKRVTMERFAKLMLENFSEIEIELIADIWDGVFNVGKNSK